MPEFATVAECTESDVASGVPSERVPTRDEMSLLLQNVAATARPRRSSLRALGQVIGVLRRCPWVDGDLRMELAPDGAKTAVHLYTEHGGVRERVLSSVAFPLGFEEVDWGLAETPELFAPLVLERRDGKLVFTPPGAASTALPPQLEVAAESTPHERPTVKRPAYVLPEAYRSGKHRRHGSQDDR